MELNINRNKTQNVIIRKTVIQITMKTINQINHTLIV